MKRKRPVFITCLAIVMMFIGLFFPFFLFHVPSQPEIDSIATQCGLTAFLVREFGGSYLQGYIAFLQLITGTIGIGLWRMQDWARGAMVLVSGATVLMGIEELTEFFCTHGCQKVDFTMPVLCAISIWYFSRRKVKLAFTRQPVNTVSTS